MFPTLQAKLIAGALLALFLVSAFGAYTFHERQIGANKELAKFQVSSAKALKDAQDKIAALTLHHAADVAAITETFNAQHKNDLAQSASDAERLRNFDAYRRTHPAMGSPANGSKPQAAGDGGTGGYDDSFGQLEQSALELADAARAGKTALNACMAERDSLTGK